MTAEMSFKCIRHNSSELKKISHLIGITDFGYIRKMISADDDFL